MASELEDLKLADVPIVDDGLSEKLRIASVLEVYDSPILEMNKTLALKIMCTVFAEVFNIAIA